MPLETTPVAIVHRPENCSYPDFPYSPAADYPELQATDRFPSNETYDSVRQLLLSLGLDEPNQNTKKWNPLGFLIQPGQTVLLKPNWVRDFNAVDPSIESLVTHSAVIRAIIDYAVIALEGKGKIVIADAPLQSCDFESLMRQTRAQELVEWLRIQYPTIEFVTVDLRKTVIKRLNVADRLKGKEFQFEADGDPSGYTLVDLGHGSFLTDLDSQFEQFRVTNYDHRLLKEHHNKDKHEYLVANAILHADVVINLPKMKTHIKAGITGALKNLIGINGHKEYLPHHVNGSFFEGGDQYMYRSRLKELHNRVYDVYWSEHNKQGYLKNKIQSTTLLGIAAFSKLLDKENLYDGGWYGNETIPRTTLDLNHILYFYDHRKGSMADQPVRKIFHVIDGVIAGEKNGPLRPLAKPAGVLIAGHNPLFVDLAMAKLIGYQPLKIKTLFYGLYHKKSRLAGHIPSLDQLPIHYNGKPVALSELPNLRFWIPKYWKAIASEKTHA